MAMGLHRLASTAIGAVILTLAICGAKAENAGAWRLHGTLEGDARPLLCKDPETTNLIVDVAPRNSRAGRAFRRVWLPRHRLASFAASGRAGIRNRAVFGYLASAARQAFTPAAPSRAPMVTPTVTRSGSVALPAMRSQGSTGGFPVSTGVSFSESRMSGGKA